MAVQSPTARTVFRGGSVFDGSGADPREADVLVADGEILEVGRGLDGDTEVDATGHTILPGFFDCHTHVCVSHIDIWRHVQTPFSMRFYEAERNLDATLRANQKASAFLDAQPAGYRKVTTFWVMSAKREETRQRRLALLTEHSTKGERLPQFVSPSRRAPSR